MRRRFLPLAAAFSMMAAAADEQQAVAARESSPSPTGETFTRDADLRADERRTATVAAPAARPSTPGPTPAA